MRNDRQLARAYGETKYIGKVCDRCGGNTRYVNSNYCVACQLTKNKQNRAAARPPSGFNHRVFVIGRPPGLKK